MIPMFADVHLKAESIRPALATDRRRLTPHDKCNDDAVQSKCFRKDEDQDHDDIELWLYHQRQADKSSPGKTIAIGRIEREAS